MKKLMTALAVCLAAGFVSAEGGGIPSVNVVGYNTVKVDSGNWAMIATSFAQVGGLISTGVNNVVTGNFADGDEIYIWDTSIQDYRSLIWATEAWDEAVENIIGAGWADAGIYSFLQLSVGQGLFIHRVAEGTVTVNTAGEVKSGVSLLIPGAGQWSNVSVPYPQPKLVNAVTWTGFTDNDEIYIWGNDIQDYRSLIWTTEAWDEAVENIIGAGWADAGIYSFLPLDIGVASFVHKLSEGDGSLSF